MSIPYSKLSKGFLPYAERNLQSFVPSRPYRLWPLASSPVPCPASLSFLPGPVTLASWLFLKDTKDMPPQNLCTLFSLLVLCFAPRSLLREAVADHSYSSSSSHSVSITCLIFLYSIFLKLCVHLCDCAHCLLPPQKCKLPEGRDFVSLSHCSTPVPQTEPGT